MQKGASTYSKACKDVNIIPNKTVKVKLVIASFLLPFTILWWHQVTVAPELNKIAVFNNGTENGFKGSIPTGGHITPNSTEGDKLLWKKAQKKLKKNKTSDNINNKNPIFKPVTADLVWNPWNVASLITSLNQAIIHNKTIKNPNNNKVSWLYWK